MVSAADLPPSSPRLSQLVNPEIAAYLNTAMALNPPLCVTGHPPRLHIYVPSEQVYAIASILAQIEPALRALRGTQFWDISVYLDDDVFGHPRLIHHCLLEPAGPAALSIAAMPALQPARPMMRGAVRQAPAAVPPSYPVGRLHSRWGRRQKHQRKRQAVFSAIILSTISFMVGSTIALSGHGGRSRSVSSSPLASPAASMRITDASQTPLSAQASLSSPSEAGSTPAIPAAPDASGQLSPLRWQPISPNQGLRTAAEFLTLPPAQPPAVTLKAVGDIIPGTNFPDYRIPDPGYLFSSVQMFLGEVDILFGNFESTLTDYPHSAKDISQGMTFAFRTPPEFAGVLQTAGFDVLSVANNHAFDFGTAGFDDTITHIEQAGMRAVGRKDDIVVVSIKGYAIAFIGFSYWDDHNNLNDLAAATRLVQTAQAQADMVIISVHAGAEGTDALRTQNRTEYFFSENRGNLVQFSRTMIDAGADLILGHGPHVPRAIELYQNRLIAYSLGNFVGYRTLSTVGPLGKSLILEVELGEQGAFLQGRLIPVALDPNGIPYIDNFFESVTLVRQLTAQDFPDTPLVIDQLGYIRKTGL